MIELSFILTPFYNTKSLLIFSIIEPNNEIKKKSKITYFNALNGIIGNFAQKNYAILIEYFDNFSTYGKCSFIWHYVINEMNTHSMTKWNEVTKWWKETERNQKYPNSQ